MKGFLLEQQAIEYAGEVRDLINDGHRFRFWINMAATEPGKIAKALASCTAPEDYREVLDELMHQPEPETITVTVAIEYPKDACPAFGANMETLGGKVTAVYFGDLINEGEVA